MKMHPKPMAKHRAATVTCGIRVLREFQNPLPIHIELEHDGKTQRLIMTTDEALNLIQRLQSVIQAG